MARRPFVPLHPPVPIGAPLGTLRSLAKDCRNCELWRSATQTVFGEGPAHARVMMIGEVPGDVEDRRGHVFVGPAGKILDRALDAAGIARADVYLTNAVKHFKWKPSKDSNRRLHQKPSARESSACFPWLEAELAAVRPEVVVCLGAVASQALFGREFRLTKARGIWLSTPRAPRVLATVHPSAVLRAPDSEARHAEMARFTEDLRVVARALAEETRPQA